MGIFKLLLVFLSLTPREAERFVVHLLAIQVNSSVHCVLMAFIHHCSERFVFLLLACRNSLYIWDTHLLSVVCFANTFQEIAFSLWLHWLCYSDRIHVNARAFPVTRDEGNEGQNFRRQLGRLWRRRVHFLRLGPSLKAPHPHHATRQSYKVSSTPEPYPRHL